MVRVTFGGEELAGWPADGDPTGHCKVFLPGDGDAEPALPTWGPEGPVFDQDRPRPTVRTYTPRRFDRGALELDVDFVLHPGGPASDWAATAEPGQRAAVAGVGRGYPIDPTTRTFHLAGDETALPAIGVLLERLPDRATVAVDVEVRDDAAEVRLPHHPGAIVRWLVRPPDATPGSELVDAFARAVLPDRQRVWIAAEASAVRTIRRGLLDRGVPVDHVVARGYWRHGHADHPDGDYATDALSA